jgi:hypothetical protein
VGELVKDGYVAAFPLNFEALKYLNELANKKLGGRLE